MNARDGNDILYDIYREFCPELGAKLADLVLSGSLQPRLALPIIDILVSHWPVGALDMCRQILADDRLADFHSAARIGLAQHDPVEAIALLEAHPGYIDEIASSVDPRKIDTSHLEVLARVLLDAFPHSDDPPFDEERSRQPARGDDARRLRHAVLVQLAGLGATEGLTELVAGRSGVDEWVLLRHIRASKQAAAEIEDARPSIAALLDTVAVGEWRLVRDDADLLSATLHALEALQHEVSLLGSHRDLWNMSPTGDMPKSEDDISDWIARHLRPRIAVSGVADRELQVLRPKQKGVGTRIDLTTTASTRNHRLARVHIEAKLLKNSTLTTAMNDQLVNRYLKPTSVSHGIYLVYWLRRDQRPPGWPMTFETSDELMSVLSGQASAIRRNDDLFVSPFIFDISKPAVSD
jgi:hypothetical protein